MNHVHPRLGRILQLLAIAWLCVGPAACEKKPESGAETRKLKSQWAKESATSAPASTMPTAGVHAEALPEATRLSVATEALDTPLPTDLPEHPDIPKLSATLVGRSFRQVIIDTYVAAVTAPDDAAKVGELGMIHHRLGSAVEAIRCFERCVKLDPKAFRWLYYLGLSQEAAFDLSAAITTLKQADALNPSYAPISLKLGELLLKSDKVAARGYFERAQKLAPSDARVYFGLAQCALNEGNKQQAMSLLEKATTLAPRFAEAQTVLGNLYDDAADGKKASVCRAMANKGVAPPVVKDPLLVQLHSRLARPDVIINLGEQLLGQNEFQLAAEVLEGALASYPSNLDIRELYGIALLQAGKVADSIRILDAVLHDNASRLTTRDILAQALALDGQLAKAEQVLLDDVQRRPDSPAALLSYANFLLRAGKTGDAERYFEQLLKIDPNSPDYEVGHLVAMVSQGKHDAAVSRLCSSVNAQRSIITYFIGQLCAVWVDQSRPDPSGFRKAKLTGNEFDLLADHLQDKGHGDWAAELRSYPTSIAKASDAWVRGGEYVRGLQLLDWTLPADRGGILRDAWRAAFLAIAKKSREDAAEFVRDGVVRADKSLSLSLGFSWILSTAPLPEQRDGATALRLARIACDMTKQESSEAFDTLAAAHAELGQFDDAVKAMQAALAMPPKQGAPGMALENYKKRLALYQARKPCRPE